MARAGPLLRSVLRLIEDVAPGRLEQLPTPPLPVRIYTEQDGLDPRIDLLVVADPREEGDRAFAELADRGMRQTVRTRRTVTGSSSLVNLGALLETPGELLVEAAGIVRPELDVSVPEAWNVPAGWAGVKQKGKGVIVGVIDTGVDVDHPSLCDAGGATRVLSLWDQQGLPAGMLGAPGPYGYGDVWDATAIDAHRQKHPGFPSVDWDGHGTAVLGIAAGNGNAAPGGRYLGVAPDADLVVVALEARRNAFSSTSNIAEAIEHVFNIADSLGRRAVVNLSQGVRLGPHDPGGDFETQIAELLAKDDERILVTSAGNVADAEGHARVDLGTGATIDLDVVVPVGVGPIVLVDVWYDRADALAVEVCEPGGSCSRRIDGNDNDADAIGADMYEVHGIRNVRGVRANQLQIKLRTANRRSDVTSGRWTLRLHGVGMTSGNSVHAWLDRGLRASPRFAAPYADADCTATSPAAADGVLSVGSYVMSPPAGALWTSSGRGPNLRGSALRLLAAPGVTVTTCTPTPLSTSPYAVVAGTSYAAAHVTGAIALMLEAAPTLTRQQVLDCLLLNARADGDVSSGPATGWGAGKLDIHAALACATAPPPIQEAP